LKVFVLSVVEMNFKNNKDISLVSTTKNSTMYEKTVFQAILTVTDIITIVVISCRLRRQPLQYKSPIRIKDVEM
jgi:hypothetical protein